MGLCSSCGHSKDVIRDKGTKICGQIHTAVTLTHETSQCNDKLTHAVAAVKKQTLTDKCITYRVNTNGIMATSFPNMNITNPIRGLVSGNRKRYKKDGFNLDLTYITTNIIAMSYPASKIEGVYRNHIDEVQKFLDSKHGDRYYIYNLCSERSYDKSKFHNRVETFPFDDHNPPKLELIRPFCRDVHKWLTENVENVAVVHCKAGKGRTGTMICCYLLHCGMFDTADEALRYYGCTRTQDRKGVTIPSQVRYVRYYERLLKENLDYVPTGVEIVQIVLQPAPNFVSGQRAVSYGLWQRRRDNSTTSDGIEKLYCIYKSAIHEVKRHDCRIILKPDIRLVLNGDVKFEFYHKTLMKHDKFQFWINTFFLCKKNNDIQQQQCQRNGYANGDKSMIDCCVVNSIDDNNVQVMDHEQELFTLTLKKDELDIVNKKDKQNKVYSADFQVTLVMRAVSNEEVSTTLDFGCKVGNANEAESDSSEADTSDDDTNEENWDSGETPPTDPRGVGYRILSECELATQLTPSTGTDNGLLTA